MTHSPKKQIFFYNLTKFCYCLVANFHPKNKTAIHDLILERLSWECPTKGFTLDFCSWLAMREILVLIMYRGSGFLGFKCLATRWKPKFGPENLRRPKNGFLLQHDELFKFKESYKMEGTWKRTHSIWWDSWNLRSKCKTLCLGRCIQMFWSET